MDNAARRITAKIEVFARDLPSDEFAALGLLLGADSIAAFARDLPLDGLGGLRLLLGNDEGVDAVSGQSQSDLMNATQSMQEMQMSFNLQYLALGGASQRENQGYPDLSDLMHARFRTVQEAVRFIR